MNGNPSRTLTASLQPYGALWRRGQNFVERRPLQAKIAASAFGFAFGDCLAQTNCFTRRPAKYQVWRTASMGAAGILVAGPAQFACLQWMDAHIMPAQKNSLVANSTKFVLDNIIGCALWQAALLSIDNSYREAAGKLLHRTDAADDVSDTLKRLK